MTVLKGLRLAALWLVWVLFVFSDLKLGLICFGVLCLRRLKVMGGLGLV